MKLKDKIKTYSFWVSIASAVILILKILGNRFGFAIDETMISDLFTALCSILVLLGIIVIPSSPQQEKQNIANSDRVPAQNETTDKAHNKKIVFDDIQTLETTSSQDIVQTLSIEENNDFTNNESNLTNSADLIADENLQNNSIEKIEEYTKDSHSFQECDNVNENNETIQTEDQIDEIQNTFIKLKENFSGNLESYIIELQEEIRKTREGM